MKMVKEMNKKDTSSIKTEGVMDLTIDEVIPPLQDFDTEMKRIKEIKENYQRKRDEEKHNQFPKEGDEVNVID